MRFSCLRSNGILGLPSTRGIVAFFCEICAEGYESFASFPERGTWLVLLCGDKFGR